VTLLNEIFGRDAKEAIKATRSLFGLLLVEHDHGETGGTSLADLRCERGAVLPDKGLIVEVEEEVCWLAHARCQALEPPVLIDALDDDRGFLRGELGGQLVLPLGLGVGVQIGVHFGVRIGE
jgi:hypothetical protein